MGALFPTILAMYQTNAQWRWLVDVLLGATAAVVLIYLLPALMGGSSVQSSYTPPTAPPKAFGSGGGGQTISMPVSQRDIASDHALKDFQVAAQSVDASLPQAQQCEALAPLLNDLDDYDRQRARPVHQTLIARADDCRTYIRESDIRLGILKRLNAAFSQEATVPHTENLVDAYLSLTGFDEDRSNFANYAQAVDVAKQQKQEIDNSDRRIGNLIAENQRFATLSDLDNEQSVLQALEALTVFDKGRINEYLSQAIENGEATQRAVEQRADYIKELTSFIDSDTEVDATLSVLTDLSNIPALLLSDEDQIAIQEAKDKIAQAQIDELITLINAAEEAMSSISYQRASDKWDTMNAQFNNYIVRVPSDVQDSARAIAADLDVSDERLLAYLGAAKLVEEAFSQTHVDSLFAAHNALTPLDRQRFKSAHFLAQSLVERAENGVLEGEIFASEMLIAFNAIAVKGCTDESLAGLRAAYAAMTPLGWDRACPGLQTYQSRIEGILSRPYCVARRYSNMLPVENCR